MSDEEAREEDKFEKALKECREFCEKIRELRLMPLEMVIKMLIVDQVGGYRGPGMYSLRIPRAGLERLLSEASSRVTVAPYSKGDEFITIRFGVAECWKGETNDPAR